MWLFSSSKAVMVILNDNLVLFQNYLPLSGFCLNGTVYLKLVYCFHFSCLMVNASSPWVAPTTQHTRVATVATSTSCPHSNVETSLYRTPSLTSSSHHQNQWYRSDWPSLVLLSQENQPVSNGMLLVFKYCHRYTCFLS